MGYVYVVDVDDAKKKVRLLTPVSERVPVGGGGGAGAGAGGNKAGKALVLGGVSAGVGEGGEAAAAAAWPEDVVGLVG